MIHGVDGPKQVLLDTELRKAAGAVELDLSINPATEGLNVFYQRYRVGPVKTPMTNEFIKAAAKAIVGDLYKHHDSARLYIDGMYQTEYETEIISRIDFSFSGNGRREATVVPGYEQVAVTR